VFVCLKVAAGELDLVAGADGALQVDLVARLRDAGRELCAHEWVQGSSASPAHESCPVILHEAAMAGISDGGLKHLARASRRDESDDK
jgi:hypothetical protein